MLMRFIRWFFGLPDPHTGLRYRTPQQSNTIGTETSAVTFLESRRQNSGELFHLFARSADGLGILMACHHWPLDICEMGPGLWRSRDNAVRCITHDNSYTTSMDELSASIPSRHQGGHPHEQASRSLSKLRPLPPPSGLRSICSVTGGRIRCFRLHADATGPFRDEEHMNLQLRHLNPLNDARIPEIVRKAHSTQHPLVFTHNDFFPRNIMIDEDTAKVVAILDWEAAGWFPSHWEYCKCINWGAWRVEEDEWRTKYLPRIVPVYEEEAEADRALLYDCDFSNSLINPWAHA